MCSLKLFVTIYFVLSLHKGDLALTITGSGNSNEHTQPAGRTSVQPAEIHNLFSNETRGHISANATAVNDKVLVSSSNDSVSKTPSQDIISTATEAQASTTPTLPTSSSVTGVAGTNSSKLNTGSISDQHGSTEKVTPNAEFPLEGGGTVANVHLSTPEHATSKINTTSVQSSESLPLENIYSDTEQSNKTSTVVARKGTEYKPSKIVARKGVETCSCCPNVTNSENCTICCGSPNELNSGEEIDEKNNLSIQRVGNAISNSNNTTVMEHSNTSTLISPTEAKKTKATKPLYTVDAVNDNVTNISAVQTPIKKLEQGSNYVVPVVGTILMVPLIAVLSVFMYKKGCEFWERRHYRRMDFLIDGMYND